MVGNARQDGLTLSSLEPESGHGNLEEHAAILFARFDEQHNVPFRCQARCHYCACRPAANDDKVVCVFRQWCVLLKSWSTVPK